MLIVLNHASLCYANRYPQLAHLQIPLLALRFTTQIVTANQRTVTSPKHYKITVPDILQMHLAQYVAAKLTNTHNEPTSNKIPVTQSLLLLKKIEKPAPH